MDSLAKKMASRNVYFFVQGAHDLLTDTLIERGKTDISCLVINCIGIHCIGCINCIGIHCIGCIN